MNHKINRQILARFVLLVNEDGSKKQLSINDALDQAKFQNLDLVQMNVAPVPVCKILDYGKMQFAQQKKAKTVSHDHGPKEIRFKYLTDVHDLQIKAKKITELLKDGHKVLITMLLKGRQRSLDANIPKEKFFNFVKELKPDVQPNEIKFFGGSYSIMLTKLYSPVESEV